VIYLKHAKGSHAVAHDLRRAARATHALRIGICNVLNPRGTADALRVFMNAPKHILVPIDFSAFSEQALDYAAMLAHELDATMHLVNAIGIPAMGAPEIGLAYTASMIDKVTVENQQALDKLAATHRNGGKVGEVLVRTGDARDVILQAAEEVKADLIVLGTHGRRGISRALLGSVAEMIVRSSPVPVLTVRGKKS
jgi:nucleotide-binding universal stress UspA family protein